MKEPVSRSRLARVVGVALVAAAAPACQETTTEATPPLAIQCSANPASGAAPLSVAFALDIANAVGPLTVAIAYGDGTQGTDPDARHVYAAAGDYVASITVSAGATTARCSIPISVTAPMAPPPPAENRWPNAWFRTNPGAVDGAIVGKAPLYVAFNMCLSNDPDDDRLYFRMDLDGDGSYELAGATGGDCRHDTTYAVGTRTATICVTDIYCPDWPSCSDLPRFRFHPYQCSSYTVTATP